MASPRSFHSKWAVPLAGCLFAASGLAARILTESTIPDGISQGCADALLTDIACSNVIKVLQPGFYYSQTNLQSICDDVCASALASYHNAVVSNCASDSWTTAGGVDEPVAMITELMRYSYNLSCLTHEGRFCNNVAAAYAAAADPDGTLPAGGDFGDHDTSDPCDLCLVKNLQFQAESPYYDGLRLQSQSIYESKTASCGVSNMPLTTKTASLITTTLTVPSSTPTCTGTVYSIQPGDDCHKISLAQGIGTEWLLLDNDLFASCHNFPTQGELCLINTCTVYTVLETDTCAAIAKMHSITESQLRAWNPSINAGCQNLEKLIGDQLCISKPGKPYIPPGSTTLAPSIPTTAAPQPTNVASGTNTYCGRYYQAQLGDYCNLLVMKFSISLADFRFLNPAINENCTNLYAEESYCVQAVGDINTYSGKPGYTTHVLTRTGSLEDSATTFPPVVWSSPTPTTTQIPLASGTRKDCYSYLVGDDWQTDLSGTDLGSNCNLIASVWDVTLEDLRVWNPSLGDTSDPSCAFASGVRYCAKYYYGFKTYEEEPGVNPDLPVRDGMAEDCTLAVYVNPSGGQTCQEILDSWELTIAQFYEWNPSVGSDCSGMWAGYQYCVRTEDYVEPTPTTASTTISATATTSPTAPGPTQDGQPSDCDKWHLVQSGDDCSVIYDTYGITQDEFLEWNPAVSEDCLTGFWASYAYCVGVASSNTTPTTTSAESTSTVSTSAAPTDTGPVAAPEPNQAGNAIASCNEYGQAQEGDWCSLFADSLPHRKMEPQGDVFDLTIEGSDQNLPEPLPSTIRVDSTQDSLERFDSVFHGNSHRQSIKDIIYQVVLPPVTTKRLKKLQSSREAATNNVVFTQAIFNLFNRLSKWEGNQVALTLKAGSPSDDAKVLDALDTKHGGSPPIWDYRNVWKFLMINETMLPSGVLPQVGCISKLELSDVRREIHPQSAGIIAAASPKARDMTWGFLLPGRRLPGLRKEIRSMLAHVLAKTPFPAVETWEITLGDTSPLNENFELESYCEKGEDDDLSLAVRRLLSLPTLTNLKLTGSWILSPVAFLAPTTTTFSSSLTNLRLELAVTTPTGGWISTGDSTNPDEDLDPEYYDSEASRASFNSEHSDHSDFMQHGDWEMADGNLPAAWFRYTPDPSTFNPLFLSLVHMFDDEWRMDDEMRAALRSTHPDGVGIFICIRSEIIEMTGQSGKAVEGSCGLSILSSIAAVLLGTVCQVRAKSAVGDRVLVVLEDANEKQLYSQFWQDLESRDFLLSFESPKNDQLSLFRHGELAYDHLILTPPKSKGYGPALTPKLLVDYTNAGGNVLLGLSSTASTPSAISSLLLELDISLPADRTSVVVDHFHFDTSSAPDKHDVLLLPRPQPLRQDVINFFGGDGVLALPNTVGQSLGNASPLLAPILKAPATAYTHNPKDEGDSVEIEDIFATGSQLSLISALQARNNARFVVLGSLEMLQDKWFDASVQAPGGKASKTVNREFAQQLTEWVFKEVGVLKVVGVQHQLVEEASRSPAGNTTDLGFVNPPIYRIKNDVTFSITLSLYSHTHYLPFNPPPGDEIQLEFSMLSPFHRLPLVDYNRPFLTNIEEKRQVTVRHFAHDEWPRSFVITGAWPWVTGLWSVIGGFLVLTVVWLYCDPQPIDRKRAELAK
ncbi:hypothetical protein DV738_g1034, partial [Chaetothyriales sp. CBS 135597]